MGLNPMETMPEWGTGLPDPFYPRVRGCRGYSRAHPGVRVGHGPIHGLPLNTTRVSLEARDGSPARLPVPGGGVTSGLSWVFTQDSARSPPAVPVAYPTGFPWGSPPPRSHDPTPWWLHCYPPLNPYPSPQVGVQHNKSIKRLESIDVKSHKTIKRARVYPRPKTSKSIKR